MNRTKIYALTLLLVSLALTAAGSQAPKKKQASKPRTETSSDIKKKEENTRREINNTREQIKLNEQAVQRKLNELNKIGDNIAAGKLKVADAQKKVNDLNRQISTLEANIKDENGRLDNLREEYLKTIKQIRAHRKKTSTLAFLFSSSNFNEALRRMRYLGEYSRWRKKKAVEIETKVRGLRQKSVRLADTKKLHDQALSENLQAQNTLNKEFAAQNAVVTELKKNGDALHSHLARKQKEANELKGRIASLIAEEQRKAEAARIEQERKKAEAERKAAETRRAAELAARKEAEALAARQARERADRAKAEKENEARELAARKAQEKADKDNARREKEAQALASRQAKENARKEKAAAKEKAEKEKLAQQKSESKASAKKEENYAFAEARKRAPRSKAGGSKPSATESADVAGHSASKASSKGESTASASLSGFASMKGSLPRPVAGPFRVLRKFGNNTIPDMQGVCYDNPGIDAEVQRGSAVSAVYGGSVSGVYMLPGYSTVVIINHDGYYTVYGNISHASVKTGDTVKQGHSLGKVADDPDNPGHGLLHFEVWKNREKQNPMSWLR